MSSLFQSLLNIILPPRCPCCGKIVPTPNTLCASCFNQISFISHPYCAVCGMPFENEKDANLHLVCPDCAVAKRITRLNRSAVIYDDFSKKGLLSFKFYDQIHFAKIYAKWLKAAGADIFEKGVDLIIPVPLSYPRLLKRRYNQAAVLARELSKLTNIKNNNLVLKKIKHTKPQSSLSEKARLKNLKNAFIVSSPDKIKAKRILLIDDVMTTGATLSECAKVLLKAGAKSVDTLTVARTRKS